MLKGADSHRSEERSYENSEAIRWAFSRGSGDEVAALPADAGNHGFVPDWGDDKKRLCSLRFDVRLRRERVVPFGVVLWVQSVKVVGGLDYFSGDQTRLTSSKTIGGVSEATVCVLEARMVVPAVRGGAAGAVSRDQARVPVHVVGAFALGRVGARAGSRGGRAGDQAAVFSYSGAGRGARGGAGRACVDVL